MYIKAINQEIKEINPINACNKCFRFFAKVEFNGSSISGKFETKEHALEFIKVNSEKYEPTYEEITYNGKFTCD